MKTLLRSLAVVLLVTGGLLSAPTAAGAVSATLSDPSGDVSDGTFDITSVGVDLTASTVTVAVHTASTLPALTDPSWATENSDGRAAFVTLGEDFGIASIFVYGDQTFAIGSHFERWDACDSASSNVSGSTLTITASAECFSFPGQVKVIAEMFPTDAVDYTDIDVAVAGPLDDNFTYEDATPVTATLSNSGYYELGADGGVFAFGTAPFYGSTGSMNLNAPVVSMATQPSGGGYRFVASDGGIFSYGSAAFYGSMGGSPLNKPIVGMANTPSGNGYWLVASDGGIFAYGDATFYGSMGGSPLNKPIVGMASTPTGNGYWLVASDGGIFSYGDASFYGSTGSMSLNSPVISMIPSTSGHGYVLIAKDGGVFAYGDAPFHGSGANTFDDNVVAAGRTSSDNGYYLVGDDGSVVNYGTINYFGDIANLNLFSENDLNSRIVGFAVKN